MPRAFSYEISAREVEEFFGPAVAQRGKKLVSQGAVGPITRRRSGLLMALNAEVVENSASYHCMVEIDCDDPPMIVDSTCSCPEGYDCAHAAALAIASIQPAAGTKAPAPATVTQGRISKECLHAAEWARALLAAARASENKISAGQPSGPRGRKQPPSQHVMFYVTPGLEGLVLRVHTAREKSDGSLLHNDKPAHISLDNPPKYLRDEDIVFLAKLNRILKNSVPGWYSTKYFGHPIANEESWSLVEEIAATGKLFCSGLEERRWNPICLRIGAPRKVVPTWLQGPEDSIVPGLAIDPSPTFLSLRGLPLYVDIQTAKESQHAELGRLESDLPPELLVLWHEGKALSPEAAAVVAPLLVNTDSPIKLPAPPTLETLEMSPESFVPSLDIALRSPMTTATTFFAYPPMILGEVKFDYGVGGARPPLGVDCEARESIYLNRKHIILHRLPEAEKKALARLAQIGLHPLGNFLNPSTLHPLHRVAVVPDASASRAAWAGLLAGQAMEQLRSEGWKITVNESAEFEVIEPETTYEEIENDEEGGGDWFRFETGVVHEGRRLSLLPALAAALTALPPGAPPPDPESFDPTAVIALPIDEEQRRFVKFPARRFYRVLQEIRHLLADREGRGSSITMHRIEAALLADSLGSTEREALRELGAKLRGRVGSDAPPSPPAGLKTSLRSYQAEGYQWLQFLAAHGLHGVLADDMGLGKTVQTLAHILREVETGRHEGRPSLVVAPTSVLPNWASESAKFAPGLKTLVLHGKERAETFGTIPEYDLVVTSYPLLVRDEPILVKQSFHVVVLDEAQAVKNPATKMARAACRLKSQHRICLSGTPLENHLGELWSLFRFLMPGFLGSHEDFSRKFRTPIEKNADHDRRSVLQRKVRPLILRRTKDQVATELPPKTVITHPIEINEAQQELYESVRAIMDKRVRDALAEQGVEKSHILFLQALLKLRQICCHPRLLGDQSKGAAGASSAKLDYLLDMLPVLLEEGRRILLFSQFTSMLAIIREHIERLSIPYTMITGSTTDRRTPVDDFQKGRVPLFLISLKAGGTGLNLTAADTVIHYDPWWNPAVESQATDRAHRIGQDKPVFVHRLICKGTVEERIQELQDRKSNLVASLLSGTSSKIQLDEQTISDLLAPLDGL